MRRFLVKKTGDCGSPPTTKKPKADSERLAAAREYEDRRRRGFKASWRDEFAWLTYEPAPADSDSNGAQVGAPAATGSASSDDTTTKGLFRRQICHLVVGRQLTAVVARHKLMMCLHGTNIQRRGDLK